MGCGLGCFVLDTLHLMFKYGYGEAPLSFGSFLNGDAKRVYIYIYTQFTENGTSTPHSSSRARTTTKKIVVEIVII